MSCFTRLRTHPVFASYFDAVHPLFWWVLFWQLCKLPGRIDALGGGEVLITISWWGIIYIDYVGGPTPSAYRSIAPTRKAWNDPAWETALPTSLNAADTQRLIFPCASGGSGRPRSGLTKGACALFANADTS